MENVGLELIRTNFWKGKRVYLTGHTGFKGSWLSLWLAELGAIVKGYALKPPTNPSLFQEAAVAKVVESEIGDIRNLDQLQNSMKEFNPDVLIHMAAQPLVRYSYVQPIETYEVNVVGTAKVLESARTCDALRCIVNVTTDKCYENREWEWGYRENDLLGGYDPYSSSKACAEIVSSAYRRSYLRQKDVGLATARAGNVIGGGDWAEARLVPDVLRAFEKNEVVIIRNPLATRPWQHVLEPLSGYLMLAEKLYTLPRDYSGAWNFGPHFSDVKPVRWVVEKVISKWPGEASWQQDKQSNPHEAECLKLDISKAESKLGWHPVWSLESSIGRIIKWHNAWLAKENMQTICLNEVRDYLDDTGRAK